MRTLVETKHYAVVKSPGGNDGKDSWEGAMLAMLDTCERLRDDGYRPLHYVPRMQGWVCEKPSVESWVDEPTK